MMIRDRIREFRRVPASSLRPSAHNWRTHPITQRDALKGLLAEIGYAGATLCRELADGTLEIIDGHLRAEEMGTQDVPVLITDLDETEAKKLLATYDPLGAMAEADSGKLESLLSEIETDNDGVAALLEKLKASPVSEGLAAEQSIAEKFQILIDCDTESRQAELLQRFTAEGLACRSLIS